MNSIIQHDGKTLCTLEDKTKWIKEEALQDISDLYTIVNALKSQLDLIPRQPSTPLIQIKIDELVERIGELKHFLEVEVDGVKW